MALPEVGEVEVVDPSPESLQLGRQRVDEVSDRQPGITLRWLSSLDEASRSGDLCIVATHADVRCQIVREVTEKLGYDRYLIEKLVAQTVSDYERLTTFADARGLSIWVDCKNRTHSSHQRVKEQLVAGEPIVFIVSGGNHGLANVGVHAADLFIFYDDAERIYPAGARIDERVHPSKRASDVLDLSGTLLGYSDKGSHFVLSFSGDGDSPVQFSIVSPTYRALVDDITKGFYESKADNNWKWEPVPFEANLHTSYMTRAFAADILSEGRCQLPTLKDCFPAHEFILSALYPHFNRLLEKSDDRCPVA